ncbi:MAG TPA: hypothetical protein VID73_12395 [Ktedonobacterales bacterium]
MPTYLERYLAGEHAAVWDELAALGPLAPGTPLHAEARAVARATMTRARANVATLVQRLTALGYRFTSDALGPAPTPFAPPTAESLAALRALEEEYGPLPLALGAWYEVGGAVDFSGIHPRLGSEAADPGGIVRWLRGRGLNVRLAGAPGEPDTPADPLAPDPDFGLATDPLVIWPCIGPLVDESPGAGPGQARYSLGFAPDAITKAGESGGDGPHMDFGDARADAPLHGDDWEGVPFVSYLRTVFAWGGFPGLRAATNPPRALLDQLRAGLLAL